MILIADDNSDVRRMIRSLLEETDADVAECSDGGAAIEAFEDLLPDWLLMDINMLPMDGLTAMRATSGNTRRHGSSSFRSIRMHEPGIWPSRWGRTRSSVRKI